MKEPLTEEPLTIHEAIRLVFGREACYELDMTGLELEQFGRECARTLDRPLLIDLPPRAFDGDLR